MVFLYASVGNVNVVHHIHAISSKCIWQAFIFPILTEGDDAGFHTKTCSDADIRCYTGFSQIDNGGKVPLPKPLASADICVLPLCSLHLVFKMETESTVIYVSFYRLCYCFYLHVVPALSFKLFSRAFKSEKMNQKPVHCWDWTLTL